MSRLLGGRLLHHALGRATLWTQSAAFVDGAGRQGITTWQHLLAPAVSTTLRTGAAPLASQQLPPLVATLPAAALSTAIRSFASSSSSRELAVRRLEAARARRAQHEAEERERKRHAVVSTSPTTSDAVAPDAQALTVSPSESTASELQLLRVLDHPALIITRPIEWGTVIFGYEQANKYNVLDQDGQVVALIAEDQKGLGNEIGRQLLRTRRSFTSTVLSADGSQVIFRVRRPAYLISSTMYVEDGSGNTIGEIHQRWNLFKRNYDLYMNKVQFAAISGNFLAWEFELKSSSGSTLALIDRNFQGFGKELFTDAGKYVLHFGYSPKQSAEVASKTVRERSGKDDAPPVTPMALARTDVAVIPTVTGSQLVVQEPLPLSERMITLAAAIAIDYDYFSQHSTSGGGLFAPPLFMPLPMPFPGGGGAAGTEAAAGAAGAEGAAGAAGMGAGTAAGEVGAGGLGAGQDGGFGSSGGGGATASPSASGGLEQDLGGDSFPSQTGDSGSSWGAQDAQEGFKWDDGAAGGGAGDGEAAGGVGGILGSLWGLISDNDS